MHLVIDKHDDSKNKKSHPEWQCWLEVTDLSLVGNKVKI